MRNFYDNLFDRALFFNKSSGVNGVGHNAIMLLNKDNEGLIFSFYSTDCSIPNTFYTNAEMRFGILNADEVENLLYGENKNTLFLVASDNSVEMETYDRYAYFDLPNGGYNIYNAAVGF